MTKIEAKTLKEAIWAYGMARYEIGKGVQNSHAVDQTLQEVISLIHSMIEDPKKPDAITRKGQHETI